MDSNRPQLWNPEIYQRDAGFVATLGAPLLELLAPQSGEQVLDLGCGDGTLTLRLQEAGCEVLGVDSSPDQVAAARARGLRAEVVDGHALPFVDRFDAVFSNAALHWMLNPAAVLAGVARALKPGGRFVAEMGGAGNVDSVIRAYGAEYAPLGIALDAHNPWFFPDETRYAELLRAAGLEPVALHRFARPTRLPGDVSDWLNLMTQSFTAAVAPDERPPLVARVRERLKPSACNAEGQWTLDYVRLRIVARKPESPPPNIAAR
jgi:SAM-dependent methyltransferase